MVRVDDLFPGTRLRVKEEVCDTGFVSGMKQFCGKEVTFLCFAGEEADSFREAGNEPIIYIEEDFCSHNYGSQLDGHWWWRLSYFDYVVNPGIDFNAASQKELFELLVFRKERADET